MAIINKQAGTIHCKIVYYGAPHVGKWSSLHTLHERIPPDQRSEIEGQAVPPMFEHIYSFDWALFDQPEGYRLHFHLCTIRGPVLYGRDRIAPLNGADGVVFVADSQRDKLQENIKSLQELARAITRQGRKMTTLPLVLQYNKRDIPNALPLNIMDKYLRPLDWQRFETVATLDAMEPLLALRELVVASLLPPDD